MELNEEGDERKVDEVGNPLIISPCVCSGSTKYVHLNCLHTWIEANGSGACSVCKTAFPDHFEARPPFLKLRVVRHQRGVTWRTQRHFLISFASKNTIIIGKRDCDLVLPDPSVSKVHASIVFDGTSFKVWVCAWCVYALFGSP